MKAWLIDAGLPGHTLQVETVGRVAERRLGAACAWLRARLGVRGGLRSAAKRGVERLPRPLLRPWLRWMYPGLEFPAGRPDVVITSGSGTIPLCRMIRRVHGTPAVFLGEIHRPRADAFELVVAPVPLGLPQQLLAPLTLTGRTPDEAAAAARARWPGGAPAGCWTMVVGGDGKAHRFAPEEWTQLAAAMNEAARRAGVRWLITTSRRTGAANERRLREALDPALVAEAIWWADAPQRGLMAMVHAGGRVFVTRDSLTMISEVVAIKGRAEVVRPARGLLDPQAVFERYLLRLEQQRRVVTHPVGTLAPPGVPPPDTPLAGELEAFEQALAARLAGLGG